MEVVPIVHTKSMNILMMKSIVFIVGHLAMEVVLIVPIVNINMGRVIISVDIAGLQVQDHVQIVRTVNMKSRVVNLY